MQPFYEAASWDTSSPPDLAVGKPLLPKVEADFRLVITPR